MKRATKNKYQYVTSIFSSLIEKRQMIDTSFLPNAYITLILSQGFINTTTARRQFLPLPAIICPANQPINSLF